VRLFVENTSRADDATTLAACRRIDDADTRQTVMAERAFVARLGGGCLAPMGALCSVRGAELELTGVLADPSGSEVLRLSDRGSMHDPERLGTTVAETVIARGGEPMLAAIDQARAGQA
jgi:hydroxymethylbilane synthase